MSSNLSILEKKILDRIQQDFPFSPEPYAVIGADTGCTEDEAHAAVLSLRKNGIIRRIGGSFVPGKLGYTSTLVAAKIDPDHLEDAAAVASSFAEVTHNYEREAEYNLWFTIVAENRERMDSILEQVGNKEGVSDIQSLPALNTFKIKVNFDFTEKESFGRDDQDQQDPD